MLLENAWNPYQIGLSRGELRAEHVDTSLHGGEVAADIVVPFAVVIVVIVVGFPITVVFVSSAQLGLFDLFVEAN